MLRVGDADVRRSELEALATGDRVDDMASVPFVSVEALAGGGADVTHATFHALDGYAASIPIEQARQDGVLLVPPEDSGRTGVRLVVSSGHTTCLNVKGVVRIELGGPGKHTVDPNPHTPGRVPTWD